MTYNDLLELIALSNTDPIDHRLSPKVLLAEIIKLREVLQYYENYDSKDYLACDYMINSVARGALGYPPDDRGL